MKNLINILSIVIIIGVSSMDYFNPHIVQAKQSSTSNFCDGWDDGYPEGWQSIKGEYSIAPLPPICPLPNLGESRNSYKDGYNRGFVRGRKNAKNQ